MKKLLTIVLCVLMAACRPYGSLVPPGGKSFRGQLLSADDLSRLPHAPTRVRPGDTLRIVRDAQDGASLDLRNMVEDSQAQSYPVRTDGSFSYRYAGRIEAAGKTPDDIAKELRAKLEPYYREPGVTVNITASPSNRLVIGGAVRNPVPIDLNAVATLEQAIFAVGGLLPSADPRKVVLMRQDDHDRYQVYFIDLSRMLEPTQGGRQTLAFQRGDVIFVPKSDVGNWADGTDLFFNQLLPFTRAIGINITKTAD
jgi:protein involved in polysaccharide export with SLBB domain